MTDPVKKYEELRGLTEGWFNDFFKRSAPLPSNQQRAALNAYQEKYQVLYVIKDFPRKRWNASQLIQGYKNGEITNNTEIKKSGTKDNWVEFSTFLKYEPFKSALENIDDNSKSEVNPKINFVNIRTYNSTKKIERGTLEDLANYILNSANGVNEDDIKVSVLNPKTRHIEWQFLNSSALNGEYQKWKAYLNKGRAKTSIP